MNPAYFQEPAEGQMNYLYDDADYVTRNSIANKWLKPIKAGRSYWAPSIVNAVLCDINKVSSAIKKLHGTSHARHVKVRKSGVIDD